jgi:hypothetical protein
MTDDFSGTERGGGVGTYKEKVSELGPQDRGLAAFALELFERRHPLLGPLHANRSSRKQNAMRANKITK